MSIKLRSLILAGLMVQSYGAGVTVAGVPPLPPQTSRRAADWRSSSGSAIAVAILKDLARRSDRRRRVRLGRPSDLSARASKRVP